MLYHINTHVQNKSKQNGFEFNKGDVSFYNAKEDKIIIDEDIFTLDRREVSGRRVTSFLLC